MYGRVEGEGECYLNIITKKRKNLKRHKNILHQKHVNLSLKSVSLRSSSGFQLVIEMTAQGCAKYCTEEQVLLPRVTKKPVSLSLLGLLQFSTGLPPQAEDAMSLPASSVPHVTVQEEDGEIRLLVIRAQGLLGRVTVGFKTVSLTAFSPEDYQVHITKT